MSLTIFVEDCLKNEEKLKRSLMHERKIFPEKYIKQPC